MGMACSGRRDAAAALTGGKFDGLDSTNGIAAEWATMTLSARDSGLSHRLSVLTIRSRISRACRLTTPLRNAGSSSASST